MTRTGCGAAHVVDQRDVDREHRGRVEAAPVERAEHPLGAGEAAPDFFFDPIAQVRLDRWFSRRVALVGDAGYCPTPLTGLAPAWPWWAPMSSRASWAQPTHFAPGVRVIDQDTGQVAG